MEPFEKVVQDHGAVVLRVCRALLGGHDADDVWSETFLAALRAYPTRPPEVNARAWLVTIAHRKAIDHMRKARRSPVPTGTVPDVAVDDAGAEPLGDELRRAVEDLAPKQRGAVVLHHIAGLPYAEVGVALGCSEAAARRSAADGIARLRTSVRMERAEET